MSALCDLSAKYSNIYCPLIEFKNIEIVFSGCFSLLLGYCTAEHIHCCPG